MTEPQQQYIITDEQISKILWWVENLGLKPVEDCLNDVRSRPAPSPEYDKQKIDTLVKMLIFEELLKIPELWEQHDATIRNQTLDDAVSKIFERMELPISRGIREGFAESIAVVNTLRTKEQP